MRNRIIAVLFIIAIFSMGGLTVLRSGQLPAWTKSIVSDFSKDNIAETESLMNKKMVFRMRWINVNGIFNKCFGVTADMKREWYRLDDGRLMYSLDHQSSKKLARYAKHVEELKDSLPEGTRLIYVQLPFKIENDEMLPAGAKEYANENVEVLLKELKNRGIETIDIKKHMKKDGLVYDDQFYKTDHHWRPQTAKWAAGVISQHLAGEMDWIHDQDLFEDDNFRFKHYDDQFLGSLGKKTGNWYAGTDDFDLIIPKYKTDFEFWADTEEGIIERSGDFEHALLDKKNMEKNYFRINTYATYTGGDFKENIVTNHLSDNHKKVLLLRDSFSCTLLPYLSLSCEQVTTLDLRHFKKMSTADYVKEHDFDVVLIAYNPSAFTPKQFDFTD